MFENETRFVPEALAGGRRADDYLLFFASFPPPEVAQTAARTAQALRATHHLEKAAVRPERVHMTVQPVCTFAATLPGHKLNQVLEIANELTPAFAPFPMRFDRAGSMGRRGPSALALKADTGSRRALVALTGPLSKALESYGFKDFEQGGELPHMTLVYGAPWVADHRIEPCGWQVDRLVLIVSHRGCGHYERIGSWPLRGAVPAELF